ncbi:MAG: hypothetical protein HY040_08135 [Planctomycetes bacterium]|nr:hypothetical protein [Planctomycetota bacterium]
MKTLRFAILTALLGWLWCSTQAPACPFCAENRGPTLIGEFEQADMVLFGTLKNPKLGDGGLGQGTTDLEIEVVLKDHEFIKGKKVITLPRYVNQLKNKFLVFCEVYKGKADSYRGVEVLPDSDIIKYLQGALERKSKTEEERLRFCFEYLNSPDAEVSQDAYREFAKAEYKEYANMARKLPADTIAGWLRDEKTPAYRYGLYASLLGHCGNAEHAKLLRSMIDDPEKYKSSGIDGLLAGYMILEPKEGLALVTSILSDGKNDFQLRYPALRTLRFLWDQRPDLVESKKILGCMGLILQSGDMADFAIEDLRKWKRWEFTEQILDLYGKKSHDVNTVKRSIVRYALRSPEPRATSFIQEQRRLNNTWVNDLDEILNLDDPAPAKK